jgi:hypothetical protein
MPSLSAKDRVSLCQFSFADGRRCRTPRTGKHPHFCFDHAQKEARALAEESLSKDLSYFFSGDYLSACDLSTAMGRLIPAVIRGDVKPRAARTVAYMAQILLQSIQISQHEYWDAFGGEAWRKSSRNSVKGNYNHHFPDAAKPEPAREPHTDQAPHVAAGLQTGAGRAPQPAPRQTQAETQVSCHSEPAAKREEPAFSSFPAHAQQPAPASQPAPPPHTHLPPGAEFAQQLLADRNLSRSNPETGAGLGPQPQPAEKFASCHSACPGPVGEPSDERPTSGASPESCREEPVFSSSPAPSSPPPSTQPAPVAHSFISDALPPHVRRRLHRTEDSHLL